MLAALPQVMGEEREEAQLLEGAVARLQLIRGGQVGKQGRLEGPGGFRGHQALHGRDGLQGEAGAEKINA